MYDMLVPYHVWSCLGKVQYCYTPDLNMTFSAFLARRRFSCRYDAHAKPRNSSQGMSAILGWVVWKHKTSSFTGALPLFLQIGNRFSRMTLLSSELHLLVVPESSGLYVSLTYKVSLVQKWMELEMGVLPAGLIFFWESTGGVAESEVGPSSSGT